MHRVKRIVANYQLLLPRSFIDNSSLSNTSIKTFPRGMFVTVSQMRFMSAGNSDATEGDAFKDLPPLRRLKNEGWISLPKAKTTKTLVLEGERKEAIRKLPMEEVPLLYKRQEQGRRRFMESLDKAKLPTVIDEYGEEKVQVPMISNSWVNEVDMTKERANFLSSMTNGGRKEDLDAEFYDFLDKDLMVSRENRLKAASIVNRLPSYQDYELETEMRLRIIGEVWNNSCNTVSHITVSKLHSECDAMVERMQKKYQPRILLEAFPFRHQLKALGFELMPDLPGDRPAEGLEDVEDVLAGRSKAKSMKLKMETPGHDVFDEYKRLAKNGKLMKAIQQDYFTNYPYVKTGIVKKKHKISESSDVEDETDDSADVATKGPTTVPAAAAGDDISSLVNLFAPVPVIDEESYALEKENEGAYGTMAVAGNGQVQQYEGSEDLINKIDKWYAVSEAALESIRESYDIQGRHYLRLMREEATAASLGPERLREWEERAPTTFRELEMIELLGRDATPENLEYAIQDVKNADLGPDGKKNDDSNVLLALEERIMNSLDNRNLSSGKTPDSEQTHKDMFAVLDRMEMEGDPEATYLKGMLESVMKEDSAFQKFKTERTARKGTMEERRKRYELDQRRKIVNSQAKKAPSHNPYTDTRLSKLTGIDKDFELDYKYEPTDADPVARKQLSLSDEMRLEEAERKRRGSGQLPRASPNNSRASASSTVSEEESEEGVDSEGDGKEGGDSSSDDDNILKSDFKGGKRGPRQYHQPTGARSIDSDDRLRHWARQASEEDSIMPQRRAQQLEAMRGATSARRSKKKSDRKEVPKELSPEELNRMYDGLVTGKLDLKEGHESGGDMLDDLNSEQLAYLYEKIAGKKDLSVEDEHLDEDVRSVAEDAMLAFKDLDNIDFKSSDAVSEAGAQGSVYKKITVRQKTPRNRNTAPTSGRTRK